MWTISIFGQALVQILCNTWGASRDHAAKGVDSLRGELSVVRSARKMGKTRRFLGISKGFSRDFIGML
jgi:hypothetical protein